MSKKWQRNVLPPKPNSNWKGRPGFKIFIADRGNFRLDFPRTWVIKAGDNCVKFHDAEPPDDNCVLAVSYFHKPADVEWPDPPLADLVIAVVDDDPRLLRRDDRLFRLARKDIEIGWIEATFVDPGEEREAISCVCLARGFDLQLLLIFDFWADQQRRFHPIWLEMLRSLQMGINIQDSPIGPLLN